MSKYEFSMADFESPSWGEVFMNEQLKSLLGGLVYGKIIRHIELHGTEKVLDFGCGNGVATRMLAKQLANGGDVVGLEPSKFWSQKAETRLKGFDNVTILNQSMAKAGFAPDSFDVITVFHVLHDIPPAERAETVRQLADVLKPGGKILFWEPTSFEHGMAVTEIKQLAGDCSLRILNEHETKKAFVGIFSASN